MTHAALASLLGPEFDDFLFAPVGEDRNGMLLSVLSALARADVDPWQEAARLARLPKEIATQSLSSLIAALPGGLAAHLVPRTIAARLILLLPRPASSVVSLETLQRAPRGIGAVTNSRHFIHVTFILAALVLGALALIGGRHLQARVGNSDAPSFNTFTPQVPPPTSGR